MKKLPFSADDLTLVALRKYARAMASNGKAENPYKFLCTPEQLEAARTNLPRFVKPMDIPKGDFLDGLQKSGSFFGGVENFMFYRSSAQ